MIEVDKIENIRRAHLIEGKPRMPRAGFPVIRKGPKQPALAFRWPEARLLRVRCPVIDQRAFWNLSKLKL
jgi:hypothetical protein